MPTFSLYVAKTEGDGVTITNNADNTLSMAYVPTLQVGDFETDFGDWVAEILLGSPTAPSIVAVAHKGSKCVRIMGWAGGSSKAQIKRTIDLTGVSTFSMWVNQANMQSGSTFQITIGGTLFYNAIPTASTWVNIECDVSSLTGDNEICLISNDNTPSGGATIYVDDFTLEYEAVTNNGAGN